MFLTRVVHELHMSYAHWVFGLWKKILYSVDSKPGGLLSKRGSCRRICSLERHYTQGDFFRGGLLSGGGLLSRLYSKTKYDSDIEYSQIGGILCLTKKYWYHFQGLFSISIYGHIQGRRHWFLSACIQPFVINAHAKLWTKTKSFKLQYYIPVCCLLLYLDSVHKLGYLVQKV